MTAPLWEPAEFDIVCSLCCLLKSSCLPRSVQHIEQMCFTKSNSRDITFESRSQLRMSMNCALDFIGLNGSGSRWSQVGCYLPICSAQRRYQTESRFNCLYVLLLCGDNRGWERSILGMFVFAFGILSLKPFAPCVVTSSSQVLIKLGQLSEHDVHQSIMAMCHFGLFVSFSLCPCRWSNSPFFVTFNLLLITFYTLRANYPETVVFEDSHDENGRMPPFTDWEKKETHQKHHLNKWLKMTDV